MQGDQFSILFIYKINERERKVVKFEFPFRLVSVSSYVFFFWLSFYGRKNGFLFCLLKSLKWQYYGSGCSFCSFYFTQPFDYGKEQTQSRERC